MLAVSNLRIVTNECDAWTSGCIILSNSRMELNLHPNNLNRQDSLVFRSRKPLIHAHMQQKKPPHKATSPFQGQKIQTLLLPRLLLLAYPSVQSLLSFCFHYLALLPHVFLHHFLPPTSSTLFSLPSTDPTQFFSTYNISPHSGKLQLLSDSPLFLHTTTNSPRNLFLLPTLKMETERCPKHWQQITTQHSHIPEVYNLQQQCHGNRKSQNFYTYRVYHIKHTLTL